LVGIFVNRVKDICTEVATALKTELSARSISFVDVNSNIPSTVDLVVVIGGDGTVLNVAEQAAKTGIPVLAVNAGDVGFLSCFEANEIVACADFISAKTFETEERPLICANYQGKTYYALNEVSVQRGSVKHEYGCTLSLSLNINGEFVDSFRSDGIIIATPTGSTAYSLSAGGAVLAPALNALIATPLCAHTLRSKPIVYSDALTAEIVINSPTGGLFCDGRYVCDLQDGGTVQVKRSEYSVKFIKGKRSFYQTLFRKLTAWSGK